MRQTKRRQLALKPLLDRLRKIVRGLLERVLQAVRFPIRPPRSAGGAPRPLEDWWARVKGGGPPEHWLAMLNERLGEDGYPFDLSFPVGQSAPWPGDIASDPQAAGLNAQSQQPAEEVASAAWHSRVLDDGALSAQTAAESRRTEVKRTTPRGGPRKLHIHAESTPQGQNPPVANWHAAPARHPSVPVRGQAMRVRAVSVPDSGAWQERAARSEAVQLGPPATRPAPNAHHDGQSVEWEPGNVVDMPSLPAPRRAAQFPHRLPMPSRTAEHHSWQRSEGTQRAQWTPSSERPPLPLVRNAPATPAVHEAKRYFSEMRSETRAQNQAVQSLPAARRARSGGKSLRVVAAQRKPGFTEVEPLRMDAEALPAWPSLPDELPDEDDARREWRDRDDLARLEREQRGVE
jgi:hypothetical protein